MSYVYIRTKKSTGRYVALDYVRETESEDKRKLAAYKALYKDSDISKGVINHRDFERLGKEFSLPALKRLIPDRQNGACPFN